MHIMMLMVIPVLIHHIGKGLQHKTGYLFYLIIFLLHVFMFVDGENRFIYVQVIQA